MARREGAVAEQEGTRNGENRNDPPASPEAVDLRTLNAAADQSGLWRSRVSRLDRYFNRPDSESRPLEREHGITPREINNLVDAILNFDFERNMRSDRWRECTGQNLIGRWRAWLGGQSRFETVTDGEGNTVGLNRIGGDFQFVEENENGGYIRHNWQNETWRKIVNVGLRTGRTAGIGLAFAGLIGAGGLFFGAGLTFTVGAAFVPGLIGSTIGRGVYEGIRAGGSKERKLRGQIEAVRIRYFQKCRELATIVSDLGEWNDGMELSQEEFNEQRNAAIENLINFVYNYENLGVVLGHTDDGNESIRSVPDYARQNLEEDEEEAPGPGGFPRRPGRREPSYVRGVELYQPSDVAPDAIKVKDLEEELAKVKSTWDKWEERTALAGGLLGGALSLIHGWNDWVGNLAEGYRKSLDSGEAVKLHINGNPFHGHLVQQVTDSAHHLRDQFVYHLRGVHEAITAKDAGASIMNLSRNAQVREIGRFGSHLLNESGRAIDYAIWQKSVLEAIGSITQTVAELGISFWLGRHAQEGNKKNEAEHRQKQAEQQEQLRRRYQPASPMEQAREISRTEHLIMPANGDVWMTRLNEDGDYDPTGQRTERIRIHEVLDDGYAIIQNLDGEEANVFDELSLPEIMRQYRLIERGRGRQEREGDETNPNPERKEDRIGSYTTAAERRTPANSPIRETFVFNGVGGGDQFIVSIHNGENTPTLTHANIKNIALDIQRRYQGLSQSDREPSNLEASLRRISEEAQGNDGNRQNLSWTILITENNGHFFGFRFNNDQYEVFRFRGNNVNLESGTVTEGQQQQQRRNRQERGQQQQRGGDRIDRQNFYQGDLQDGDGLALLNAALSQMDGTGDDSVRRFRENSLGRYDTPREKLRALMENRHATLQNRELCAVITRYLRGEQPQPQPEPQPEPWPEPQPGSEPQPQPQPEPWPEPKVSRPFHLEIIHQDKITNKEKKINFELKEGQIMQESLPNGSIVYWEIQKIEIKDIQTYDKKIKKQESIKLHGFRISPNNEIIDLDEKFNPAPQTEETLQGWAYNKDLELAAPNMEMLMKNLGEPPKTPEMAKELDATDIESLKEFAKKTEGETKESYEASLNKAIEALKGSEGIVELRKGVPTVVIPDLHARREMLVDILNQIQDGKTIYELLKEGKINIVCLGDGMHSEKPENWEVRSAFTFEKDANGRVKNGDNNMPILTEFGKKIAEFDEALNNAEKRRTGQNQYDYTDEDFNDPAVLAVWEKIKDEFAQKQEELLNAEMVRSLGMMKMIMELKAAFPDSFHYIRGNHDDIMGSFYKYARESEQVRNWLTANFGEEFVRKFEQFEDSLPILVKGEGIILSHATANKPIAKEAIINRDPTVTGKAVDETGRHHGLTWTDNTDFGFQIVKNGKRITEFRPNEIEAFDQTRANVGSPNATWIIGHRHVEKDEKYRSQFGGKLIQINSPVEETYAVVPASGNFNPDTDVKVIGQLKKTEVPAGTH